MSKWVQNLLGNGVDKSDICLYDIDNLRWSGRAILDSIGSEVWFRIEKELPRGRDPTGPEVFTSIIQNMKQVNSSSVRQLINKLEKMKLKDEPGQDVLSFGDKVTELARRIEGTGLGPKDLTLICAACFLKSDSFEFNIEASRLHREVDIDPSKYTYEDIFGRHKSHFRSLQTQGLWESGKIYDKQSQNLLE